MPRTLYVHLGPRKTGTSALQHVLQNHDDSVVIYPKVGLWGDGSHHGLVFRFFNIERSGKAPKEDISSLFRSVREVTEKSDRDIIISSEALRAGMDIGAFIGALRDQVGGSSTTVELILVYREHFSRTASWYNHRVRALGETRTPDEFLNDVAPHLCYFPLLRDLDPLGFGISVLNYHPSDSVIARFLAHIGFQAFSMPKITARRVSLSPKGLLTKLAINNFVADKRQNRDCYLTFRKIPGSHAASQFIFGPEASARAEQIYAPDREYLNSRFSIQPEAPGLRDNAFQLDNAELEQIANVAEDMGDLGKRILGYVAEYVRQPSG